MKFEGRERFAFRKMECIFSIMSEEFFSKKSREYFSMRNTSRTLGQTASDTEAVSDEYSAIRRKQLSVLECPMGSCRMRLRHCSHVQRVGDVSKRASELLWLRASDAGSVSDATSSDASDDCARLQTSLSSVRCVMPRLTHGICASKTRSFS